jgi:hypothetical protein
MVAVGGLIIDLWSSSCVADPDALLARSTVQYFKPITLAAGDLAVQTDRIVVLLANDQDKEVQESAQLLSALRILISGLRDDEVNSSRFQVCLVQYFTAVHEITLKKGHRHPDDLKKAKARLTSPLNSQETSITLRYGGHSERSGGLPPCVGIFSRPTLTVLEGPHSGGGTPVFLCRPLIPVFLRRPKTYGSLKQIQDG